MLQRHVLKGVRIEIIRPLFPRYVFVFFDREMPVLTIVRSTIGVSRLLGSEKPEPLPPGIGEFLRSMPMREPPQVVIAQLLQGMRVRIKTGPLTGHAATISRRQRERVKLLMSFFGRQSETDWLPASWVEALSAEV